MYLHEYSKTNGWNKFRNINLEYKVEKQNFQSIIYRFSSQ